MNLGLIKTLTAGAAIGPRRIVKFAAAAGQVVQAADAAETLLGVTGPRGAKAAGDRIDVYFDEIREIGYGGKIIQGDPLTSDADGKAVKAAPSEGANANIIGVAMISGVDGDIGSVHVSRGRIQG